MVQWKDIKGYEGRYRVSEKGDVFSCKSNKLLKQGLRNTGYLVVHLYDDNIKRRTFTIHRLVADNFIDNPANKQCVNHIDGNKSNNKVSNLEWCTHSENNQHAWDSGLKDHTREKQREVAREIGKKYGKKNMHKAYEANRKKVIQYNLQGEFLNEFKSLSDAARYLGNVNKVNSIWLCCKGKQKTAYGYKWSYSC